MSETSLKIKIPAKGDAESVTKTVTASRKVAKRRIDSDSEDSDASVHHNPVQKKIRLSPKVKSDHSFTPSPPPRQLPGPANSGASLDEAQSYYKPVHKKARLSPKVEADDKYTPPLRQPPKHAAAKATSGPVATSSKAPLKKKTRIVSESEDSDFHLDPEEKLSFSSKPKTKEMKGKVKSSANLKITAKNESKPALPPTAAPSAKKRPRDQEDLDMDVDVTTISVQAPAPAPVPVPVPDDPPPKKKLPTIKKHKKTDSTATSAVASPAPPSTTTPKPAAKPSVGTPKPPIPSVAGLPKKPPAPVQATTMNPSGTGDFDLREPDIWKSLIGKGSSSSGPKVGIEKRVSTEERRKQLDKMRDEARSEREKQTRETFDLQAQSRKIAAFEKKMHNEHQVRINGPHYLGAAFIVRPIPEMRPR